MVYGLFFIKYRTGPSFARAKKAVTNSPDNGCLWQAHHLLGLAVQPADLPCFHIYQHYCGWIVLKDGGAFLVPFLQDESALTEQIATSLYMNNEKQKKRDDQESFPEFVAIRGKKTISEGTLSKDRNIHEGFEKPEGQHQDEPYPDEIIPGIRIENRALDKQVFFSFTSLQDGSPS